MGLQVCSQRDTRELQRRLDVWGPRGTCAVSTLCGYGVGQISCTARTPGAPHTPARLLTRCTGEIGGEKRRAKAAFGPRERQHISLIPNVSFLVQLCHQMNPKKRLTTFLENFWKFFGNLEIT